MQGPESLQVPLLFRPRGQLPTPATASQNAVRALAVGNAIEAKRSLHAVTHGLLDELSDKSGLYLAGGVVLGALLDKTCSDIDVFLVRLTEEEAWARLRSLLKAVQQSTAKARADAHPGVTTFCPGLPMARKARTLTFHLGEARCGQCS